MNTHIHCDKKLHRVHGEVAHGFRRKLSCPLSFKEGRFYNEAALFTTDL